MVVPYDQAVKVRDAILEKGWPANVTRFDQQRRAGARSSGARGDESDEDSPSDIAASSSSPSLNVVHAGNFVGATTKASPTTIARAAPNTTVHEHYHYYGCSEDWQCNEDNEEGEDAAEHNGEQQWQDEEWEQWPTSK